MNNIKRLLIIRSLVAYKTAAMVYSSNTRSIQLEPISWNPTDVNCLLKTNLKISSNL
ncbi:hypothetical protein JHK82_041739 [Glycine max]|nr:hypothetical protein JHK82_041739 [Glycine max]